MFYLFVTETLKNIPISLYSMGMASIAMYTMIFVIAMAIIGGMVSNEINYFKQHQEIVDAQKDQGLTQEISILNASYSNGITTVWVENKDSEPILDVDFYVAGQLVPRSTENRTLTIYPDTRNPGQWDPGEKLKSEINKTLEKGSHKIVVSVGKVPEESSVISGTSQTETLFAISGQWTPDSGTPLNASELLAVNNKLGTDVTLSPVDRTLGLLTTNPSHTAIGVKQTHILVDYTAPNIDVNELLIEARDNVFDGNVFCSAQYGPTGVLSSVQFNCNVSYDKLDNIFILISNLNLTEDVTIDYVAVNTSYVW